MKPKTTPAATAVRDDARGYTEADRADVLDHPEASAAELAAARPFAEVFPDLAAMIPRTRGPQKAPTKEQVSLRLDRAVVEKFKADGPGWQVRMGEALRKAAGLRPGEIDPNARRAPSRAAALHKGHRRP